MNGVHMGNFRRAALAVAAAGALTASLSGCTQAKDFFFPGSGTTATPTATATATQAAIDSQFTDDGTYQSHDHDVVSGMDFVLTMYPTKSTPRTHEWYALGDKHFTFTFQAYDLDQALRDDFSTKRKAYLKRVQVTSTTTTTSGTTESPYSLDAVAKKTTFDPQPVSTKNGMLITSPKGSFELRNQTLGTLALDTTGVTLTFHFTVYVEDKAKSKAYTEKDVEVTVPVAIYASTSTTTSTSIPVDAN
jgi:hypothetical protein